MKETLENCLEQQRVLILGAAAVMIQKHWRGAIARFVILAIASFLIYFVNLLPVNFSRNILNLNTSHNILFLP